jgi:hypothetical protein
MVCPARSPRAGVIGSHLQRATSVAAAERQNAAASFVRFGARGDIIVSDDRTDLIESHLKQLETFRQSVGGLQVQQQESLTTQWKTLREILTKTVLPKLGHDVQLASRSMMALVTSCLAAATQTEGLKTQIYGANNQPTPVDFSVQFRGVWAGLIQGQLVELEELLRHPPPAPATSASLGEIDKKEAPDRESAKTLLDEAAAEAKQRESGFIRAGMLALLVGTAVVAAAATLPFILNPTGAITGWAFVAAWGVRVLAVAALLVAVVHFLNVFRDMMGRAAAAGRERALLRMLAASTYLATGKDQASALVDLVKTLAQQPTPTSKESALVVPAALVKELPEIIKLFKSEK